MDICILGGLFVAYIQGCIIVYAIGRAMSIPYNLSVHVLWPLSLVFALASKINTVEHWLKQ